MSSKVVFSLALASAAMAVCLDLRSHHPAATDAGSDPSTLKAHTIVKHGCNKTAEHGSGDYLNQCSVSCVDPEQPMWAHHT